MTIDKKTVLVLGAGASKPYGYPLGSELRAMLTDQSLFATAAGTGLITNQDAQEFCGEFLTSGTKSIDSFLSRRGKHLLPSGKSIEHVGKIGISLALRQKKSLDALFQSAQIDEGNRTFDVEDNWYEYLWDVLIKGIFQTSLEKFSEHKLTIVSFNYDLSLEHYLFTAMHKSFGMTEAETARHLSSIKFIHLYGQLAGDPFSTSFNYDFQFNRDQALVMQDVASIQVIDDDRNDGSKPFDLAYRALENAERICFLGFGYDPTNVERLGLPKLITERISHAVEIGEHGWPTWVFSSVGMLEIERRTLVQSLTTQARKEGFQRNPQLASEKIEQIAERFHKYADHKSLMTLRQSQVLFP
jgi:hypothetical protein